MKKTLLFLLLTSVLGVLRPVHVIAQSVAINADSSSADPSAILDLKSSIKGFLAPRMTLAQRNAIAAPATGLLIYQTDNSPGFYCYDGAAWGAVKGSGGGGGSDPFWTLKDSVIFNTNNRHVGIGTDTAQEPLTVQTGDLQRGFSHRGENGKILTSFMGDNFAEFATLENTDLYLGAGGFPHIILNAATGNVGINNPHPQNIFEVGRAPGFSGHHFAFGDGTYASGINQGLLAIWQSNTDIVMYPSMGVGNFGINANIPANKLQVGSMGPTGIAGNDIAFGNGAAASAFAQGSNIMQLQSSTDITLISQGGAGHVGINSPTPVLNELQVGSVGSSGFVGNNFAIGNGAQATAFNQYGSIFQIASNTDFALLPQAGTGGRLGINTATPQATLDVEGSVSMLAPNYFQSFTYLGYDLDESHEPKPVLAGFTSATTVSILASNNIMAMQFDAYSDARIKKIIGHSNAAQDLRTLNAIEVTDYSFKDKIKYGGRVSKKVIAQQVEQIYPQVVSRHRDVVPNVFQPTAKIDRQPEGRLLLTFTTDHNISPTAKKLQIVINEHNDKKYFDIVSIPAPDQVVIDAPDLNTDRVFVYGEEVDDFRSVDYEGLTTLNISATQELSKKVERLEKALASANENIRTLANMIRQKANPLVKNRLTSAKLAATKSTANQTKKYEDIRRLRHRHRDHQFL